MRNSRIFDVRLHILLAWVRLIGLVKGAPLLHVVDHMKPVVTTVGTDVKLSCSAKQWTDGYTITWSKNNSGEVLSKNLHIVSDPSKFSVTTVTSSEFESTTWTLTIKDTVQSDSGDYTCSLKTEPPQFITVSVLIQIPVISDIPTEAVRWDVSECCKARSVPDHCIGLCNTMSSGFNVIEALQISDRCRHHHDHWFRCLANERNHTPCCKRRHVPEKCLDLCLGNFSTVFREGNLDCLHFAAVIFKCFHDGRESIPSPPRNVRVAPLGSESLRVSWSPPLKHGKEVNYTVIYKAIGNVDPGLRRAGGLTKAISTAALGLILSNLIPGETYTIHVVALNTAGSSQGSEVVTTEIAAPLLQLVAGKATGQNLEGRLLSLPNTTLETVTTSLLSTSTHPTTSIAETRDSTTTTKVIDLMQLQNVAQHQDDFVVFDKCFGSDDFRSTCSEVFKGRNSMGQNTTIVRCRDSLPRFIRCAADGGDHRKCCSRNAIPLPCVDYCAGKPTGVFDMCHFFLPRILACFKEGQLFLTSEPMGIETELRESQIIVKWKLPLEHPEMIEQYVVTIEEKHSGEQFNMTVPRDTRYVVIDPLPFGSEYYVYVQTENFHGLSPRSASVIVKVGELSNNSLQQNVEPALGPSVGPAVAIGISVAGIVIVALVLGIAYGLKRRRRLVESTSEEQLGDDQLQKPVNAFYIPGYFGRRGISQKTSSNSSASYATSFSLRRSSPSSEPVYSDVSGAYLWMFGNDKKVPARAQSVSRPSTSASVTAKENLYDNNIPPGK